MNLSLVLKDKNASNSTSIMLYVSHNGKRVKQSTKISIAPNQWDDKKQKPKLLQKFNNLNELREITKKLDEIQENVINEIVYFQRTKERQPSKEEIKSLVNATLNGNSRSQQKKLSFYEYFEKYIETKKLAKFHRSTANQYETMYKRLRSFADANKMVIDYDDFNVDLAVRFNNYIQEELLLSDSTAQKDFKRLCAVLKQSNLEGMHKNGIYAHKAFKVKVADKFQLTLTEKDIAELYKYDFSENNRLEKVRDYFVFACHTACRFCDVERIEPFHIIDNERLFMREQKSSNTGTSKTLDFYLFGLSLEILTKYNNNLKEIVISNQKTNDYLREIFNTIPYFKEKVVNYEVLDDNGRLTKISSSYSDELTFHSARRSFATNRYIEGWELSLIKSYTLHSNERTLMGYINPTKEHERLRNERIKTFMKDAKPIIE